MTTTKLHSEPRYALLLNPNSGDPLEPTFKLLMVEEKAFAQGEKRQLGALEVRGVMDRMTHYVDYTFATPADALSTTSFEVVDYAGKILKETE